MSSTSGRPENLLSTYRVLELSDEKAALCGKLLGDLGADVIKIEPPSGDPARNLGPFYHDEPHPEKSLSWLAFNLNKRSITLDIASADGKQLLKRLVRTADFVVDSFPVGFMTGLGLGHADLARLKPDIITVSVTPFGESGPYRDFRASDLTVWALGGKMHSFGDADRAPVRISHGFQAGLNAGSAAAAAAMIALYQRKAMGEGQHVVISMQEVIARLLTAADTDQNGVEPQRGGIKKLLSGEVLHTTMVWPCKDGDIIWSYGGGPVNAKRNKALIAWMYEEGMGDDFLRDMDWELYNTNTTTQEILDRIKKPTAEFFMTHTKEELFKGALQKRIMLSPVSTVRDIHNSEQLAARDYWVDLNQPQLGTTIRYPGNISHATDTHPGLPIRAPMLGEHNREIYEGELGLSAQQVIALKQAGVI